MPEIWDADIELTEAQVASRIAAQFPDLAPVRLAPLGVGWDNVAFLVNDVWVFRFPRRWVATQLLETETRVLPLLAPHLPLPVPALHFVGRPTTEYPHVFAGYRYLHGTTACRRVWKDEERARCAPTLARFLSTLHHLPLDAATRTVAPSDTIHRAECARWVERLETRLKKHAAQVAAIGLNVAELVQAARAAARAPSFDGSACLVHGDLYPRHLLVGKQGEVCGVIDWGDVHVGDPALDLSIAFTFLPPSARAAFRDAYGDIAHATWRRAHFRSLHYGAALLDYGASIGDDAMRQTGLDALRFASEE